MRQKNEMTPEQVIHFRGYLDRLEVIRKEFHKIERMIYALYSFSGRDPDYGIMIDLNEAIKILGVRERKFRNMIDEFSIVKYDTYAGPRYLRREIMEIQRVATLAASKPQKASR